MTDYKKLIETALHPERNGLLIKRGIAEGANHEHLIVEALEALLHQVEADTRIDESSHYRKIAYFRKTMPPDINMGAVSEAYIKDRLAALTHREES